MEALASTLYDMETSQLTPTGMYAIGIFVGWIIFYWTLLRPRMGGPNAPPVVVTSPLFPFLPTFLGVFGEFLKSPNEMMKRCAKDYGNIFTIPVRRCSTSGSSTW